MFLDPRLRCGHISRRARAGRVPPGRSGEAPSRRPTHAHGPLSTPGEALTAALAEAPDVVKPNARELAAATGGDDPEAGAAALAAAGARAVVASLGPEGLLTHTL
ncbi:PfkB family carbohydrate kinase [Streptomyces sp. NPDC015220]|uniref:PfkB family carbohydrate kinase n=1 Tax=Streptomyces sp. NPDC015220 TaxID=3364947 RepID=UPI0036FC39E3